MADIGLFVVHDDSVASERAVEYIARFVGRRSGFHIYLVHVLPPLPDELLEHGGAENPGKESRIGASLRAQQHKWISDAKKSAKPCLKKANAVLQRAGIPKGAIRALFCEVGENQDAADTILSGAREFKCHTIIIGRESVSWFHELLSQELPEELLRRGKGFSIWIIE